MTQIIKLFLSVTTAAAIAVSSFGFCCSTASSVNASSGSGLEEIAKTWTE